MPGCVKYVLINTQQVQLYICAINWLC